VREKGRDGAKATANSGRISAHLRAQTFPRILYAIAASVGSFGLLQTDPDRVILPP